MPGVKEGRLGRSLNKLTFGVVREMDERRDQLAKTALTERDEQFQAPISGVAGGAQAWGSIDVTFRVGFVNATGQRDSPYIVPTFTFGYQIDSLGSRNTAPPLIAACVTEWKADEAGIITGAVVHVGVLGGDVETSYRGKVHLNFQGYGAPNENEIEETDS